MWGILQFAIGTAATVGAYIIGRRSRRGPAPATPEVPPLTIRALTPDGGVIVGPCSANAIAFVLAHSNRRGQWVPAEQLVSGLDAFPRWGSLSDAIGVEFRTPVE